MIHYHVWFNLKPGVTEADGLAVVARFLKQLCVTNEATAFQLLSNQGKPPRSKLPRYHALVEFANDARLAEAMKQQATRGIHTGFHGAMIEVVTDFHVEIFSRLQDPLIDPTAGLHAREI